MMSKTLRCADGTPRTAQVPLSSRDVAPTISQSSASDAESAQ
jgi:hypothetical protein